jgi:hypothetical protein
MSTTTERLREQHRTALALVKSMPLGAARRAALQRLDALAVKIRGIERAAESK